MTLTEYKNTLSRIMNNFAERMKRGVRDYEYHYQKNLLIEQKRHSQDISSNGVEQFCNDSDRRLLKAKTKGLIIMDHLQRGATIKMHVEKAVTTKHFQEQQKPSVEPSAWFSGEYDERTYY